MQCPFCGTDVPENARSCPKCGTGTTVSFGRMPGSANGQSGSGVYVGQTQNFAEQDAYPQTDNIPIAVPRRMRNSNHGKNHRHKPHIVLRLPLQLLSLVLSIVLMVCLLATALLLDLNRMLSAGGMKQLVDSLLTVSPAKVSMPVAGAVGMGLRMDDTVSGDWEIPADALTDGDAEALVDWMMEILEQAAGTEVDLDRSQLQEFVEQSTISEYMSQKAAGYATDFINGTKNTQITSQELMQLLEENEDLITSTFQVEFTGEMKAELETALAKTIEDNRINEVIHEEVFASMQETIDQALPIPWEQIQAALKILTSDAAILTALGVCLVLMLLLCALNFYNIPGGLTWSAVSCIFVGALLSAPIVLLLASPELLTDVAGLPVAVVQLILSFASVMSLVHFGILILGVTLLVLSVIWRLVRAGIRGGAPTAF